MNTDDAPRSPGSDKWMTFPHQEMELFRENLDTDRQQQLEAIIGGVGARIQEFQRQQHTQYQVECLTDRL